MSIEGNKAMSRRLYEEVFGRGSLEAADTILDLHCVSHGPGSPPAQGSDGIKRQAALLRTAMPDFRVTCHDQVAEGDRVVSRWFATGTHSGSLAMPSATVGPTGRAISFEEIRIDRYANGRIVESWFIPDRMTLWQQLGLIPTPGQPPPR